MVKRLRSLGKRLVRKCSEPAVLGPVSVVLELYQVLRK
jgi:hypothetical protein